MSTIEPQDTPPLAPPAPPAESSPPRKGPLLTLAVIGGSVLTSWLWWSDEESHLAWLFASGVELWQGTRLWVLFMSLFPHLDGLHLLFNSCWCWHFGRAMEGLMPRWHVLGVMLVTTLFSSVSELAAAGDCGVGMSGMVYGLFGFMLATQHEAGLS